jgi:peroxiredoxin
MKSLEKNHSKFKKLNAVAFGVNIDHVPAKKAWAKMLRLKKTRLLSDFWPHGEVAKRFAIFRESDGFSERANIIIDEEGNLVWVRIYPIKQLPDIDEVLGALARAPCECCSK